MRENGYTFLDVYAPKQRDNEQFSTSKPDIIIIKETLPRFDKVVNPILNSVWDAWLIGLEQSGYDVHREPPHEKDSFEPEM